MTGDFPAKVATCESISLRLNFVAKQLIHATYGSEWQFKMTRHHFEEFGNKRRSLKDFDDNQFLAHVRTVLFSASHPHAVGWKILWASAPIIFLPLGVFVGERLGWVGLRRIRQEKQAQRLARN